MLRVGLGYALLAFLGTGFALFACGSLSSPNGASGAGDSGIPDTASGMDAPADVIVIGPDAGSDGPSDSGLSTGALFVHASPDLLDMRFCWAVADADGGFTFSAADVPFPSGAPAPYSNYPAVPVGGAAPLPDASSMLGGDLTIVGLEAFTLAKIEPPGTMQMSCSQLLDKAPPTAIHYFPVVPAGSVVAGATNVISIAGCLPAAYDPSASTQRCGSSWAPLVGNVQVDVLPLHEVTAVQTGQLPVQAAQLSPALAVLLGDGGAAVVSFGAAGSDAAVPVAALSALGSVDPSTALVLDAGTAPTRYGDLGFGVDVRGFDGGAGHLWMSLEQSLQLVAPMEDPSMYYAQATTYVVAVVGDPNAPHGSAEAGYDGKGLHVLVLPLP